MKIEIEYDILPVNTGYTDKQKCILVSYFSYLQWRMQIIVMIQKASSCGC